MGDEVIDEYGTLQLGKDFQDAQCMLNSEVALLLSKRAEDFSENEDQPPYASFLLREAAVKMPRQHNLELSD
jgi:hypothetical protein